MKQYFLHVFAALMLLSTGCNYLEVVPENDIQTIETIFEKREQVEVWFKSCYVLLSNPIVSVVESPAFMGADEVVAGEYFTKKYGFQYPLTGYNIANGLQMTQEPFGNIWKRGAFYTGIRYCNIFLQNIHRVYNMADDEKKLWSAEIKALKAHFYFELFRRYGPIILVPENIPTNVEIQDMQQPRASIDECVEAMVDLLDEAMIDLPLSSMVGVNRLGYHNLEGATALKAQVLFYAASPLFNGNQWFADFTDNKGKKLFPAYDAQKWERAAIAIDSAISISVNQGGKTLVKGFKEKSTKLLSTMNDIENSSLAPNFKNNEALLMIRPQGTLPQAWFTFTLPRFKTQDIDIYNSELWGIVSPSMKMVEMYYTENGLPIESDVQWEYASRYQMSMETNDKYEGVIPLRTKVLGLHLRREPRFYAHIAADRCYWQRGADINNPSQHLLVEAYRKEKFGAQYEVVGEYNPMNLTGYWMKKGSYSDYSSSQYPAMARSSEEGAVIIRLAELYLMQAEAWNEYLSAPTEKVYTAIDEIRERAGILPVREAWTTYSKTPDKVNTQAGMRDIIRREWNIEFAFEGKRFWNLRRWLTAHEELNGKQYGWNVTGDTAQKFFNNFEGPIPVWNKRKFIAPRDYLFPIKSEEVMISNIPQNPGW